MISFIVPAYIQIKSDEEYLYPSLNSIFKEISRERDGSEIILVLKCSKEKEQKFWQELNRRYGDTVSCYFYDGNRSEARNLGAKIAKSNILTFVDADTRISKNFIPKTIEDFKNGYGIINYRTRPLPEEKAKHMRLHFYTIYMNFLQRIITKMNICRPYGFCMSVRKDISEAVSDNGELFRKDMAGYGEDAEFGRRYAAHCNELGLGKKYEKKVEIYTSLREWYKHGLFSGGVRLLINSGLGPFTKRPMVANWRDKG